MRWLRYAGVAAAGIVAGATFFAAFVFAAYLATVLLDVLMIDPRDDPIFGYEIYIVLTWPIWLPLLLAASGLVGFISARRVHKKLSLDGTTPRAAVSQ